MFVSLCLSLYVFQSFLSLFVFYSLYSRLFFFLLLSFYLSVFRIVFLPSSLTLCLSYLSQKTGEHFAAMTSANLGCELFYWSSSNFFLLIVNLCSFFILFLFHLFHIITFFCISNLFLIYYTN